jgi:pimeloyl-ACP methyl ester carboxylesterase
MDASDSDRAIVAGFEDGAALSFLFAATYPDRVAALISIQPASRGSWAPDAPWLDTEQAWAEWLEEVETSWGTPEFVRSLAETIFPDACPGSGVRPELLAPRPSFTHEGRRDRERSDVEGHRHPPCPAHDPGTDAGDPQRRDP